MKKILTIALCAAVIGSAGAQKAKVDEAKKLAGKIDKIEQARTAIKEAKANAETQSLPNTYLIAAEVEFKAFDKMKKDLAIDAKKGDDPAYKNQMNGLLLAGYPEMLKAVELAKDPKDAKKVTGDAQKKLAEYLNDFFQAGADYYGAKQFYPEAYNGFVYYGDIPGLPFMNGKAAVPDSLRAQAYYNAGLCGWAAEQLRPAAEAFRKARQTGADKSAYIYELACWQNIAQRDSTAEAEARNAILDVSRAGYDKFGIAEPVFLNNMINVFVEQNKYDDAIKQINSLLAANENAALYGLRGFVFDRMNKDDESIADYRKAISFADADFETLRNAGKKLLRRGTEIWNTINGTTPEDNARRVEVKSDYFTVAKEVFNRAKAIAPEGSAADIDNLIESVDYSLNSLR